MTPLAGPQRSRTRSGLPFWLAALLAGAGLHVLILAIYLWHPRQPLELQPQAAPMAIELVMPLAAPANQRTELPPGPEQTEAQAAKAEPVKAAETQPELPEVAKAEVSLPAEKPSPVKAPEPPVEDKPEETPEPVNESADQQAAEQTTAPPSVETPNQNETVSAPTLGAVSQQQLDARQQWEQLLYAHLQRHKRYPRQALRAHQQGMPTITLTMNRRGQVLSVNLASSSGARTLDREALALAKRAEPLPLPPPEIAGERITLTVPVLFSL
ncbi:TonB family protein [Pseudomonas neustonica]|uniref:TonB family protein n=1 Tax=Pseudomonas neustonica TaxID=2487346 RepID=UPI003F4764BC